MTKRIFSLLLAILFLFLTACGQKTDPDAQTTPDAEVTTPADGAGEAPTSPINTMERMTELDGVISVTKQVIPGNVKQAVAYKMIYESENSKLVADVVLPEDYTNPYRQYTVLIYFPDHSINIAQLALAYALHDIIVVRPYLRGNDEVERTYEMGSDRDIADIKALLNALDSTTFVQNSNIYIAGAASLSIPAFRLLADDSENRISGCAVTNPYTNLPAYYELQTQDIKTSISNRIGKTYEEAPEEYEKRSAVNFVDKLIGKPILIIRNMQRPHPTEQFNRFMDLLEKDDYMYHKVNTYNTDFGFYGEEGWRYLLSWINEQDQKSKALKVEEEEKCYIVQTEWMEFHFSKLDYQKEDVMPIVTEALSLMADIRAYLGVNYTKDDAQGAICYFNSSFTGTSDGSYNHSQQRLLCRSTGVFVHEYAHMVSISSSDCLYYPEKVFVEGLASYVQYTFHRATSQEYQYFKEAEIYPWQEDSVHQELCDMIAQNGMEYNAENYKKALIAKLEVWCDGYPEDRPDYPYEIGLILADYCINQLGGMQKYMSAFGNSMQFERIYGKPLEEVIKDASAWNLAQFNLTLTH